MPRKKANPQDLSTTVEKPVDIQLHSTEKPERWEPKQVQYMMLLADPSNTLSNEEMADHLGVHRSTLWLWRNIPGFLDDMDDLLLKSVRGELRAVYSGIVKKARQGDTDAAKLVFEQLGIRREQGQGVDKHLHLHKHFGAEKEEFGI